MRERFGVRVQRACVLAGQLEVPGRFGVLARQLVVVRDLASDGAALPVTVRPSGQRVRDPAVQEPPTGQAGLLVHEGTQLLVAEVIEQRLFAITASDLFYQPVPDEFFQGPYGLF